jgi:uncharacterized protein YndB with AHSA1/START domain
MAKRTSSAKGARKPVKAAAKPAPKKAKAAPAKKGKVAPPKKKPVAAKPVKKVAKAAVKPAKKAVRRPVTKAPAKAVKQAPKKAAPSRSTGGKAPLKKVATAQVTAKKAAPAKAAPAPRPVASKPVAPPTPEVKAPKKVEKAPAPVVEAKPVAPPAPAPKPAAPKVAIAPVKKRPAKERVVMEFYLNSSPNALYELLSTPSGFSEWYCQDVDVRGDQYTFIWDGEREETTMIGRKAPEVIRFRRNDDEDPEAFFEFRVRIDAMTNEVCLVVTDHAWPHEVAETRNLWTSQIETLGRVLGA